MSLTKLVQLRVAAELAKGEADDACLDTRLDTRLAFRLADAVASEPLLLSGLVRCANLTLALRALWEGLAVHAWRDEQLAEFERDLAQENLIADAQTVLRGERNLYLLPLLHKEKTSFLLQTSEETPPLKLALHVPWLVPEGWFDAARAADARYYQQLIDAFSPQARLVHPAAIRKAVHDFTAQLEAPRPEAAYTFLKPEQTSSALQKMLVTQGWLHLARIAISLERSHLVQGHYPATLEEIPAALRPAGGWPLDPASGTPPHYAAKPDAGQFFLYYEGWNGHDDGGVMAWKSSSPAAGAPDFEQGDLCWPTPAPTPLTSPPPARARCGSRYWSP